MRGLEENAQKVKRICGCGLIAVVKADAYGHGALKTAKALEGVAECFAVSTIDEAIELREGGVTRPILVLGWTAPERLSEAVDCGVMQTVYDRAYALAVATTLEREKKTLSVQIKLDTGMNRIGFLSDKEGLRARLRCITDQKRMVICGAYSHLACADGVDDRSRAFCDKQCKAYADALEVVCSAVGALEYTHIANSAQAVRCGSGGYSYVRCGIALYGDGSLDEYIKLTPVMTLKTRAIMVKKLMGEVFVSYGATKAEGGTLVTVPLGYADGYGRRFSDCGIMISKSGRLRVVGRVCMDSSVLRSESDIELGEEITVFGKCEQSANDIARSCDTIGYEILTGISPRVVRVYV